MSTSVKRHFAEIRRNDPRTPQEQGRDDAIAKSIAGVKYNVLRKDPHIGLIVHSPLSMRTYRTLYPFTAGKALQNAELNGPPISSQRIGEQNCYDTISPCYHHDSCISSYHRNDTNTVTPLVYDKTMSGIEDTTQTSQLSSHVSQLSSHQPNVSCIQCETKNHHMAHSCSGLHASVFIHEHPRNPHVGLRHAPPSAKYNFPARREVVRLGRHAITRRASLRRRRQRLRERKNSGLFDSESPLISSRSTLFKHSPVLSAMSSAGLIPSGTKPRSFHERKATVDSCQTDSQDPERPFIDEVEEYRMLSESLATNVGRLMFDVEMNPRATTQDIQLTDSQKGIAHDIVWPDECLNPRSTSHHSESNSICSASESREPIYSNSSYSKNLSIPSQSHTTTFKSTDTPKSPTISSMTEHSEHSGAATVHASSSEHAISPAFNVMTHTDVQSPALNQAFESMHIDHFSSQSSSPGIACTSLECNGSDDDDFVLPAPMAGSPTSHSHQVMRCSMR